MPRLRLARLLAGGFTLLVGACIAARILSLVSVAELNARAWTAWPSVALVVAIGAGLAFVLADGLAKVYLLKTSD